MVPVQTDRPFQDRGSQYTNRIFQELLAMHQIRPSVRQTGDSYDNAAMESFFAILKREFCNQRIFDSHRQAKSEIYKYFEVFYNRKRLHSTLGYHSPLEFERLTIYYFMSILVGQVQFITFRDMCNSPLMVCFFDIRKSAELCYLM
jgi:putative transposase